jgi:hypothetical protein
MVPRLVKIAVAIALVSLSAAFTATPGLAGPSGEAAYADGQTYWMHSAHVDTNPGPGLLDAPPIYVLGFSLAVPSGTTGPITLPSGYRPQCNPCDQEPIHYHDHLLTGEPGSGATGTARDYRAPWRIVIMQYSPGYADSPHFVPITSDTQLSVAEADGDFAPINPSGPDPYQIWTNSVLICPLVEAG